jgi:hypothetical protein
MFVRILYIIAMLFGTMHTLAWGIYLRAAHIATDLVIQQELFRNAHWHMFVGCGCTGCCGALFLSECRRNDRIKLELEKVQKNLSERLFLAQDR